MADFWVVLLLTTLILTFIKNFPRLVEYIRFRRLVSKLPCLPGAYPLIGHAYTADVSSPQKAFEFLSGISLHSISVGEKMGVVWLGSTPTLVLCHPDSVEKLLSNTKNLEKGSTYEAVHPWLKTGLLTASRTKWAVRRKLLTPSFHFSVLDGFVEVMVEEAERMADIIERKVELNKKVDMENMFLLCALDIICRTAMGTGVNAQQNTDSEYVEAIREMSDIVIERIMSPFLRVDFFFNFSSLKTKQTKSLKILHGFTRKVIDERFEEAVDERNNKKKLAFLDVLMNAQTDDGERLSKSDIQEEVDTFMFEGHDTTTYGLLWALYLIGRYPRVQEKLHEEIDQVLDGGRITKDKLRELVYLEQVIKESSRLYGSVPFHSRQLSHDLEVEGYTLPKGLDVSVSIFNLHRNPAVWKNPDNFDPNRFDKVNSANRHPFAHVPFSAGPRNCIGQKFAVQEEKVILSTLLRKFKFISHDKESNVKLQGQLILKPFQKLNITIEKR